MTIPEKIKWAAKSVAAFVGGLFTLLGVVVAVLDDNKIDGDELGILIGAVVVFAGTVGAVFGVKNKEPNSIRSTS